MTVAALADRFRQLLTERWRPELEAMGFRGRSWRLYRRHGEWYQFVALERGAPQHASASPTVAVEMAVHPLLLPLDLGEGDPMSGSSGFSYELRRRLQTAESEGRQDWWDFSGDGAAAERTAEALVASFRETGATWLDRFHDIPGPLAGFTPSDVEARLDDPVRYVPTATRGLRLFAYLHRELGDPATAAVFATRAIERIAETGAGRLLVPDLEAFLSP